MKLLGIITLLIGISIFLIDMYLLFVSIGFRKKNCCKCKGYLIDSVQYKDKYVGGKAGRFYKRYLDYTYRYKVNGKDYTVSGGVPGTKANMNSVVNIIYQKSNPKYAYIHNLTIPMQPIIVALLCPLWIAACILGISLL